jgi:hypothetical protein
MYPHLSTCVECRRFSGDYVLSVSTRQVISAMLTFHESGHRRDPFLTTDAFTVIG